MKLILLHGAAITSSRAKLVEIKRKFDTSSVIVFDPSASSGQVMASLQTVSMFNEDRLIIWENPPEDLVLDSSLHTAHSSLVLWFDHEISDKKPILPWVKELKGEILYFPESKEISVFPFLDCLAVGDKKAFLEIDKLKNAGFDVFYFITMVFYLLRSMVTTSNKVPDFIKKKIAKQRMRFKREDIKNLYKDILEIDYKMKCGLLETDQAEFLLVSKFIG